jgi:choice-of-anchor A domain-containing protein
MKHVLFATTAALALSAGHVSAAPLTAEQVIGSFGLMTFGNAETTSESVGPVLVGGNLSGSGILDTANVSVTLPGYSQVNVFGSNSGTWAEGAHQSVAIGGSNTGSFLGAAATTGAVFPETIASIQATMDAYSAALAAMPATGSYDPATGAFSGPAGSVFDLTAAPTKPITGLLAGDVINILGVTGWTDTDNYLSGLAIWNFPDATSLLIEDAFAGYILAPYADALVNTAPIVGITADTYQGEGEIHWGPPDPPAPPSTPVDEPSLWLAFLGATFLAVWFGRRRGSEA